MSSSRLLSRKVKVKRDKTVDLPVVLYTWSLTLKEEHRLSVFENRVLWRILGTKRDEVTEGWRELHNEELHNSNSLSSLKGMTKYSKVRWAGHVARITQLRNEDRIFVEIQKARDN
jgi:hypothetical protein